MMATERRKNGLTGRSFSCLLLLKNLRTSYVSDCQIQFNFSHYIIIIVCKNNYLWYIQSSHLNNIIIIIELTQWKNEII